MHHIQSYLISWKKVGVIFIGSAIFALGFDLFLEPSGLNCGGVTGIAMIIASFLPFKAIGTIAAILNVPLFLMGFRVIGRRFFFGSLLGMLLSSVWLEVFTILKPIYMDPFLAALYGGALVGFGIGMITAAGASTGGTEIAARLIKKRLRNYPIGGLILGVDMAVILLNAFIYRDINNLLYSAVGLFVSSRVLDAVVYGLDYSKVALVISDQYEAIGQDISDKLGRGVTLLNGQGFYTRTDKRIILCAVKRQQVVELKELVTEIDPDAFVILQEAHQVLGDGFARFSADSL